MAFAIGVLITFFLTPYVLHQIGDERYGAWAIILSLTGYYGLLDLGLRAGITQYVTRHYCKGDIGRMNQAASSGLVLHLGCAVVILLVTFVSASVAPALGIFTPDVKSDARWCILILGTSTAVQLVLFPFSVVLTAQQRFDLTTAVSVTCRVLSAIVTYVMLRLGWGLIGLCIANAASAAIEYSIRVWIAFRVMPDQRISLTRATREGFRECLGFGIWSSVLAVMHLVLNFSDALVIGFLMPLSAIAFFALANNLTKYFGSIFVTISQVFYPAATDLDANDNLYGLRKLYLTGTRLVWLFGISGAAIAGLWADDFFRLWVGDKYVNPDKFHAVPLLFRVLLAGAIFGAAAGIGSKVLLGRRRVRTLTGLFALEGILNLTISFGLIPFYGLLGAAIGTTVPAVLCRGVVHPWLVCSGLGIRLREYFKEVVQPVVFVAVLVFPMAAVLHRLTPQQSWLQLTGEGFLAGAIACVLISVVGLSESDRQKYLFPTLRRLARFPEPTTAKQS